MAPAPRRSATASPGRTTVGDIATTPWPWPIPTPGPAPPAGQESPRPRVVEIVESNEPSEAQSKPSRRARPPRSTARETATIKSRCSPVAYSPAPRFGERPPVLRPAWTGRASPRRHPGEPSPASVPRPSIRSPDRAGFLGATPKPGSAVPGFPREPTRSARAPPKPAATRALPTPVTKERSEPPVAAPSVSRHKRATPAPWPSRHSSGRIRQGLACVKPPGQHGTRNSEFRIPISRPAPVSDHFRFDFFPNSAFRIPSSAFVASFDGVSNPSIKSRRACLSRAVRRS